MGEKCSDKFRLRIRLPRNSRDLLHAANLRHGTDGFTSPHPTYINDFNDKTSNIAICVRRGYKLRGNRSGFAIRVRSSRVWPQLPDCGLRLLKPAVKVVDSPYAELCMYPARGRALPL